MSREPPIGAHVLTPRSGYIHHGIFVGRGRVVHYRGLSRGFSPGPVEEVTLTQFAQGRPVWIAPRRESAASPEEVVRRARLRIGENRYRIFTNNCEHFCEWCLSGDPRSYQVEALVDCCRAWLERLTSLVRRAGRSELSTDTFA
ncbi:MAG TPA: lecithin retinol acyltransferase family protein [Steroidobacteraceae bacterium]|nr:lecithin retinol acyltransferase family protein [Steroidobacteraceae bacterium]